MQTLETVALWIVAIVGIGCLTLVAIALYFRVWDQIFTVLKVHGEFRAFAIDRARKRAEEREQAGPIRHDAYSDPGRGVDD